jgi:hypothetical protein
MVLVGYVYDICTRNPTCTKKFRKLGIQKNNTFNKSLKTN